jgi:glycogen phosphorylase
MSARAESQSEAKAESSSLEKIRTGFGADAIAEALIDNLYYFQAKLPQYATRNDWYMALAYTVRDRMLHRYISVLEKIGRANNSSKVVPRSEKLALQNQPVLTAALDNGNIQHSACVLI